MIENLEKKIGIFLYKNINIQLIVIFLFSIPITILTYFKYQNIILSLSLFFVLFVLTLKLLDNFIIKYSYFNYIKLINSLYENTNFQLNEINFILDSISKKIALKLLEKKIIPVENIVFELFKKEILNDITLKISLNDFNYIKNNLEEYKIGIYHFSKEKYFTIKLSQTKSNLLKI